MFFDPVMRFFSHLSSYRAAMRLPCACLLCGSTKVDRFNLCALCYHDLPSMPHHCYQCAQRIPLNNQNHCGTCMKNDLPYERTIALFPYEFPVVHLIKTLKFKRKLSHARLFGELLSQKIAESYQQMPDLIIPMPLHATRLRERGFNQALEIARPIAKKLNLPLAHHAVTRIKPTLAQANLPARERLLNVANAFKTQSDLTGLTIALIDDVITTGATMQALSLCLKKHQVKTIHLWCCARAEVALRVKKL